MEHAHVRTKICLGIKSRCFSLGNSSTFTIVPERKLTALNASYDIVIDCFLCMAIILMILNIMTKVQIIAK